ncbi:MAG TPA: hypothetical protein VD905_02840 [Flavobacteriales bacterium]|nr:hypothetical protein [Flavobacteriales bacterium]
MKHIILFFMLLFSLGSPAQYITESNGKKGLMHKSGKTILENNYDTVYLLDPRSSIYVFCLGNKKGLINLQDSTFYPCIYDEIRDEHHGYVTRTGSRYGFICDYYYGNNQYGFTVFEPVYSHVKFSGCCYISVARDSLYGLIFDGIYTKEVVPCMFNEPVYYDLGLGTYYNSNGKITLLRKNEETGEWNKTVLEGKEPKAYGDLLVDENKINREFIVYSQVTGKQLAVFAGQSETVDIYFSAHDMCMVKKELVGKCTHVTWLSPVTGEILLKTELKSNQEISAGFWYSERDLKEATKVFIHESRSFGMDAYTYIGEITGYTYKAYPRPYTELKHSSGSSSGKKPFFMPGKD